MAGGDAQEITRDPNAVRDDIRSWPTGRLLSVAARLVEGRFHDFLAARDLTHAGLIALHHVAEGRLAQRELATLCRVTDQTMSRTIERLYRAGYVVRQTDDRDRRRTLVEITPAGREVLETARREERGSDVLLGAVDEYDRFREQLIKLITAV
ncbi:DNA-binding MarR family transcriptional regulator [Streptosporangium becharense]|uniref:DNA-binding MarR family transcriptional regulator n=1 Tax=Streptosporangium becharense TaxID=1816182 RepID=A0A7W9IME2_9ACTN|nr:winged helix DNA-binding protein [Streptosporangium becharense]MBB2914572.1 DNA-binding MarR family transcriptional regulator [Streptosporangium becharense]MBB5823417.1 DNA-binding MarR family transcriptional regulator [Streptosporangium becharense]